MSTELIAILYCWLIFAAAVAGGMLPLYFRPSHTRMQVALSFVAGVMLGVGLLHLMPHSYFELGNIQRVAWWVLCGFLTLFFLERVFQFHHHDVPEELADAQGCSDHHHDHEDGHSDHHHHHEHVAAHELSWSGAAVGLALHSLVDGIALGAGVVAGWQTGLGILLAIVLHKPFDTLTICTLMAAGGWSIKARTVVTVLYALVAPAGVGVFFLGFEQLGDSGHEILGCALAFAAGAFLCIATSDLLPELQFHSHDRIKLSCALVLGIALAWAIETYGHNHDAVPREPGTAKQEQSAHDHP